MLTAQKVRGVIECVMCKKSQCFYSNAKLSRAVKENVDYIVEKQGYACGGSFFDEESYLHHSVVVSRQLTCSSLIEVCYYSSKIGFTPLCIHCGGTSAAPLAQDESIQILKRKYITVRPICTYCKDVVELAPCTWGKKFDKEPLKKK